MSEGRQSFRMEPKGRCPARQNCWSAPSAHPSIARSSICRRAAPVCNCTRCCNCPSASNFFTARRTMSLSSSGSAATSSAFATRRPPTSRCAAIDRAERWRSKARCRVAGFGITTPERFAILRSSAKLGFSLRFIDLVSRPIVRARYKTCIDNREG